MNKNFVDRAETIGKGLIIIQVVYNLFIKFFIDVVGLPYALNYLTDVIMALAFICAGIVFVAKKQKVNFKTELLILAGFFGCTLLSAILNKQFSIMLYAWAFRNTFRFFVFGLSCIVLLKKGDIYKILKIIYVSFWIHVAVCTVQFFGFGIIRDNLNGIFGIRMGYNVYSNTLICVSAVYAVVSYLHDRFSFSKMMFTFVACGYIAGIAEIKVYLIEVILIGIVALVASLKYNKKKIISEVATAAISFIVCFVLTLLIYPEYRATMTKPEFANQYVTEASYGELYTVVEKEKLEDFSTEYDERTKVLFEEKVIDGETVTVMKHLNRISGVPKIFEAFLNSPGKILFGLGMGNTQESSISAFNSPFEAKWGNTGYMRFSHIQMLLEHGVLGVLFYALFFVSVFVKAIVLKLKNKEEMLPVLSIVITAFCGLAFIYDKTLQVEGSGYILFILLAIPFILSKKQKGDMGGTI